MSDVKKVEIILQSDQDPSRIARLILEKLASESIVVPVNVDGEDMHPSQFYWYYAHRFPERWHWDSMAAVKCKKCLKVSLAFNGVCGQCGCNRLEILPAPPKCEK